MRAHCIAVTSSNFPDQSKIKRSGSVSRFKALGRRTSLATTRNGALRIPVYDHHGNVVAVVDDGGATVAAYEYAPFGALVAKSGPEADAVPFRFSTKYFDPETGLYYYGYRFYSPELGRWINRDPNEEEGGENLYAFCKNHEVFSIDLLGLTDYCSCLVIK